MRPGWLLLSRFWDGRAARFLVSYLDNRAAANTQALDESVLVPLLLKFLDGRGNWQGTASGLLAELESLADEKLRKRRDWPSTPRKLAGDLRRRPQTCVAVPAWNCDSTATPARPDEG